MKTVYLNNKSGSKKIAVLLKKLKSDSVVLVVPETSKLFTEEEIKFLANFTKKRKQQVIIATINPAGRKLAENHGFKVIKGSVPAKKQAGKAKTGQTKPVLKPKRFSRFPNKLKTLIPLRTFGWKSSAFIAGLIIIALLAFFILPEAKLVVATRTEPVTRDMEIRVDAETKTADISNLTIPGQIFEKEITGNKTFTPTGEKNIGKRASGFIQIYNLSKNTYILGSDTTVLRAGDREFRFTQNVSGIRPTAFIGQGEEQEVDRSSLVAPAPVVAVSAGQQYNLEPGTRVEVTNEVLGSQPEVLYGIVTDEGVTGGTNELVKVVAENDIVQAFNTIEDQVVDDARKQLVEESQSAVLLDSAVETEVVDQSVTAEVGEETNTFEAAVKVRVKALAYDRDDVYKVITDRVKRLLPSNKKLIENDDYVLESRFFVVDLEKGEGILTSHYESQIDYLIDEEKLAERLKGKNEQEIREILLSQPEIDAVDVDFYPFWVSSAPRFTNRVYLEIDKDL